MLETQFKKKVKKFLDELPHTWHQKIQQRSIRFTPDILVCIAGNFVALELKRGTKAATEKMQLHKLKKINLSGGTGLLVYPENWAEVQDILRKLSRSEKQK